MATRIIYQAILCLIIVTVLFGCSPQVAQFSEYKTMPYDLRTLITPADAQIQATLNAILADPNDLRTDFRRIQDWVATSINYVLDTQDYWQMPAETLNRRAGDCKDYSTLLCSLWRAYGVPASDVYVAIGMSKDNKRHAFLIEKYFKGKWQVIEPQVGGFIASDLSAVDTAENYAIMCLFNDVEYSGDPLQIYQKIKGITVTTSAPQSSSKGPPPAIDTFTASPSSAGQGQPVTLTWSISGATYAAIDQGIGEVDTVGSIVVHPLESTVYRLFAENSAGYINATTSVRVIKGTPAPSSPSYAQSIEEAEPPFLVGFAGWYLGDESISVAKVGQQVSAKIHLRGGSPGQYIIRIWRAISTGNDEIVAQSAFIYDGTSAEQQSFFAPSYFIGESGTRGYWVDLVTESTRVWMLPDGYPPRLTVIPRPSSGQLSINFIGWYDGAKGTFTAKKDQPITTGITLSGGSSGQYILHIRREIEGLSDQSVQQLTFDYDGDSALKEITFTPAYATGESNTRGYYLELYQNSKFIWSLSGGYPPRLTVVTRKSAE